VNRENGQLDDAIKNYELILSEEMRRAVADRGFDFRRDFFVWNALGVARSDRAEQERGPRRVAERERWLRDAISAFRHTLAIDPEDLTAHFKLSENYGMLAGVSRDSADDNSTSADSAGPSQGRGMPAGANVGTNELQQLGDQLLAGSGTGLQESERLARAIPAFLASERDRFESRVAVLVDLLGRCQQAFPSSSDQPLSEQDRAIARVLNVLHRELHLIYKLDDNAREAVATHRQNNPAANHAAQSIVIYPLNRSGAPGVADRPKTTEGPASGGGL
jgi:hypothetical protein